MKKRWVDYLSEDVYIRLGECRTTKADLPELVKCRWATMEYPFTREDALIRVLELLEANSCYIELTTDEWNELVRV